MSNQLTVIIPCKNEREHIRACIARRSKSPMKCSSPIRVRPTARWRSRASWVAESSSASIGTSGDFKNWAIPQAAHEWVLILDADERITPALADEIRGELAEPRHDGYWIYRRNHFWAIRFASARGRTIAACGCFAATWGGTSGRPIMRKSNLSSGTVGRLRERLTHYTCDFVLAVSAKARALRRRASAHLASARADARSCAICCCGFRCGSCRATCCDWDFLDGLAGLQVCVLVAYLSWLKHAYLWQLQSGRDWREADRRDSATLPAARSPKAMSIAAVRSSAVSTGCQCTMHGARKPRACAHCAIADAGLAAHRCAAAPAEYLVSPARHSALLHAADRHARAGARRAQLLAVRRRARAAAKSAADVPANRRVRRRRRRRPARARSSRTSCAACSSSRSRPRLPDCSKRIATSRR